MFCAKHLIQGNIKIFAQNIKKKTKTLILNVLGLMVHHYNVKNVLDQILSQHATLPCILKSFKGSKAYSVFHASVELQ